MQSFEMADLELRRRELQKSYLEFLRVPAMSVGLYSLARGQQDPQKPHKEDELYYVVKGRGRVNVGTEDRAVEPGSLIFVPALSDHRFHSITEDLTLLVVFAPAESLS